MKLEISFEYTIDIYKEHEFINRRVSLLNMTEDSINNFFIEADKIK